MPDMGELAQLLRQWPIETSTEIRTAGPQGRALLVTTETGQRFILKRRSSRHDPALEVRVLEHLAALGLPVAPPMVTHDGGHLVAGEGSSYSLYPYLPGRVHETHYTESDAVDAAILARAAAYGRGLAQLHRGLATLEDAGDVSVMDLPQQLKGWVRASLHEVAPAATCAADVYRRFTAGLFVRHGELPYQVIHRDAHPGNLLIEAGEVSGFVDWEISTQGPRLFDLAYCSTALLSAAKGVPARRRAWLSQLTSLVAGYDSVQPLEEVERALLGQVQMAIQLIFAAYYAGQGMTEQMDANLETLEWLLENQTAVAAAVSPA